MLQWREVYVYRNEGWMSVRGWVPWDGILSQFIDFSVRR